MGSPWATGAKRGPGHAWPRDCFELSRRTKGGRERYQASSFTTVAAQRYGISYGQRYRTRSLWPSRATERGVSSTATTSSASGTSMTLGTNLPLMSPPLIPTGPLSRWSRAEHRRRDSADGQFTDKTMGRQRAAPSNYLNKWRARRDLNPR